MKKFVSLILSALVLSTTPVFAQDSSSSMQPMDEESLPESVLPLEEAVPGILSETENSDEATTEQWRYRRCPRGYRLVAYRQRIGRIIIIRYRCVRYGRW